MAEYKIYVLSPSGTITRGIWLDCADDAEAVEQARERSRGESWELWSGPRLVTSFTAALQRTG